MSEVAHFSTNPDRKHPGQLAWLMWLEDTNGPSAQGQLWAGRVKIQDEPYFTTAVALQAAVERLYAQVGWENQLPLF